MTPEVSGQCELQEIPVSWEKLTTQTTLQTSPTELYSTTDGKWALVRHNEQFHTNSTTYCVEDFIQEFRFQIPDSVVPDSLQTVPLPKGELKMLLTGFKNMVERLFTTWLNETGVRVREASVIGNRLIAKFHSTPLYRTLKEAYCDQVRQAYSMAEAEKELLKKVIEQIDNMHRYIVELPS